MAIRGFLNEGRLYRVFASFVLAVVLLWPMEVMTAPEPGPLDAQASLELLHSGTDIFLLDVRTRAEYDRGHINDFVNIPVDELRDHLGELDRTKPVYAICQSGLRSYIACRILEGNGFDAYNFAGGFRFYDAVRNDVELVRKSTPCGMDDI